MSNGKSKDTNPKDSIGLTKAPLSTVPATVLMEVGVAMYEGAAKYRRHNYREAGVRFSVYYDATMRHLMRWFEGEDLDPDSGISHITKAISGLIVLRDAMINDNFNDDRPPRPPKEWVEEVEAAMFAVREKYPNPLPPYTEI